MLVFLTFLPIWSPTKSSSRIGAPSFVASSTLVTESNTSYSTKILNTGDTNFTTLINTNLNAYKNQMLDDYSTNLANYLLTGTPNSLKDLFKTIAVYSTTTASVETVIYKIVTLIKCITKCFRSCISMTFY